MSYRVKWDFGPMAEATGKYRPECRFDDPQTADSFLPALLFCNEVV
jgi:hypothetical protein